MFPIKDNIPAKIFPLVTVGLIFINICCFAVELFQGPDFDLLVMQFGFIPARFLWQQSENYYDLSRFVPVFTSMFLHGNLFHLVSNMWVLWIFGDNVEDSMGHGRYLLFFLFCGVVSVFVQTWWNPASRLPMLGASGAISGVLAAYLLTYPHARVLTFLPVIVFFYMVEVPAFVFLGVWILLQAMQAYSQSSVAVVGAETAGGVAWWAHIGGFAAGLVLVWLFRKKGWQRAVSQPSRRARRIWRR